MKLLKNINNFYAKYDLSFEGTTLTKNDMYDYEVLTSTLKDIEFAMSLYDTEYKYLSDLYADITTWIDNGYSAHNSFKIDTIVKLIASILGIFATGMFAAITIEYGIDSYTILGLVLGLILAVCGGVSVYQNFKYNEV